MKQKVIILKVLILFFVMLNITFGYAKYSIVYIHLGNKFLPYLTDTIKQSRLFNPKSIIYLVCCRNNIAKVKSSLNLKDIVYVASEDITMSIDHINFINKTKHNGFWRFASERFFFIDQVIEKYNLKNVFHLENDNLLYCNLEKILSVFKNNYSGIAATFDHDFRCIPGFLYIKNKKSIKKLCNFFSLNASKNLNDMQMLSLFKKQYSSYIDNLPIVPELYHQFFNLKNKSDEVSNNPKQYSKNFNLFNAIFDAAAIGQYLGGIDPIHYSSGQGFINETCLFNPSNFTYIWELDDVGRKVPFIKFKNLKTKIINLHIHSKNLKGFMS